MILCALCGCIRRSILRKCWNYKSMDLWPYFCWLLILMTSDCSAVKSFTDYWFWGKSDYWFWGKSFIDYWFCTRNFIDYLFRLFPTEALLNGLWPCSDNIKFTIWRHRQSLLRKINIIWTMAVHKIHPKIGLHVRAHIALNLISCSPKPKSLSSMFSVPQK